MIDDPSAQPRVRFFFSRSVQKSFLSTKPSTMKKIEKTKNDFEELKKRRTARTAKTIQRCVETAVTNLWYDGTRA